eukprot:gene2002-2324_t
MRQATVVCIPYNRLIDPQTDVSKELWQGFGPDGLGVITVSGVPGYVERREALLPLADSFAKLPAAAKQACENEDSQYNVGWSHGKESLRNGIKDIHKGSFYANPLQDTYDVDDASARCFSTYYTPNIWPQQDLPQLEPAFKALGSLIITVGLKLAAHCSRYVQHNLSAAQGQELTEQQQQQLDFVTQLSTSCCHKARLLHYFPFDRHHDQQQQAGLSDEDWCGWHLDHGALTGLCSAMYIKDGQEVACPDPSAGLYICDRSGQVVQARIPSGHIAYQMGQVMAIQSGGLLRATPHYVRAASAGEPGISRNTFAVFMQPDLATELVAPDVPEALVQELCCDCGHWAPGMTFGEFAQLTLHGYYQDPPHAAGAVGDSNANGQGQGNAGLAGKDIAPAAVYAAVEAAGRQLPGRQLQVLVMHE